MIGRGLTVALAAGLLIISGIVYGLRTDRWSMSERRVEMAANLEKLPIQIGDWTGKDLPLDPRVKRYAEADAILQRRYARQEDAKQIEATLIILTGRAAAISVHTPEICFANSGYRLEGEPEIFAPKQGDGDSFWQARFAKPADSRTVAVYWAWSDGGKWLAAGDARSEFARSRALYKLYLVCRPSPAENSTQRDAAQELFVDLLPELHRCLATPSAVAR